MTEPLTFRLGMIEWNVFRIPIYPDYYRDKDGLWTSKERTVAYEVRDWCVESLSGEWSCGGEWATRIRGSRHNRGARHFFIKETADAMLFKLRWYDEVQK